MSETVPKLTQHKYGKSRNQIQILTTLLIYPWMRLKDMAFLVREGWEEGSIIPDGGVGWPGEWNLKEAQIKGKSVILSLIHYYGQSTQIISIEAMRTPTHLHNKLFKLVLSSLLYKWENWGFGTLRATSGQESYSKSCTHSSKPGLPNFKVLTLFTTSCRKEVKMWQQLEIW